MQGLLLVIELTVLYILSQGLTQAIFDLVVLLFRSRAVGITVITLVAFPGTVVHELAHMFTAEILGVRTGKLTLVPEGIDSEDTSTSLSASVKTGSVMISSSDPFRRYAIGLAPIFVGMIAISALSYLLSLQDNGITLLTILYLYLLLAVSNAMFSSREDLKGFIPFIIALGAVIFAAYYAGLRIGISGALLDFVTRILDALTRSLGIVLVINIAGLLMIKVLTILTEKIMHRRIIRR